MGGCPNAGGTCMVPSPARGAPGRLRRRQQPVHRVVPASWAAHRGVWTGRRTVGLGRVPAPGGRGALRVCREDPVVVASAIEDVGAWQGAGDGSASVAAGSLRRNPDWAPMFLAMAGGQRPLVSRFGSTRGRPARGAAGRRIARRDRAEDRDRGGTLSRSYDGADCRYGECHEEALVTAEGKQRRADDEC